MIKLPDSSFVKSIAHCRRNPGFTLLELLVVVAIMCLLMALVVPPASQLLRSLSLTQSGDRLVSLLILARQNALARNSAVEVRFYQFGDPSVSGENASIPTSGRFRSLQIFYVDNTGTCSPVGKVENMSTSIEMDSGINLSSLLNAALAKTWDATNPQIAIPRAGTSYNCRAFRFLADGSTNLSMASGPWFITLHDITNGDGLNTSDVGATKLIKNYLTVQIDEVNGSLNTYRP